MILSSTATKIPGKRQKKLLLIDVRKAHLHAEAVREVFVQLPPELSKKYPGMCWRLKRCLYGTRDAPARWERLYTEKLVKMGFIAGNASACCFYHPTRDIRCVVHGDDFTFSGFDDDLTWTQRQMEQNFMCKIEGRLGPHQTDLKQARVLNRIITWTTNGIEYEADPRHAEILMRDLEIFAKDSVVTPGVKRRAEDIESNQPLPDEQHTQYRCLAARANYLSLDRPDICFAAKECCRRMSIPGTLDMQAVKRLARYLRSQPRVVYQYPWQECNELVVFVDTDFAGCLETRRSTSGGGAMLGAHLIKHWASTQNTLALSSGEAELMGILKGTSEGFGLLSLASDLGLALTLSIKTDSSAAVGICKRTGIGRVRHLAVGQLWIQDRLRNGAFKL